ncbi:MAG TPA: class I SAM-dependent methyltransferase [Thermodesulfobacteriota bacterium]|nr:class I SAM-dependent methyltransferase [Thermodesulfobacteriota bacterium]
MREASVLREENTEKGGQIHSTAVLKPFIEEMQPHSKSYILDLGCVDDSNIEFFIRLGCKIFVEDFLSANVRARANGTGEISVKDTQLDFEYPENFFDGILLWDILDHFDIEQAELLVNNVWRTLKENGSVIALFRPPIRTPYNTITRYKIISLNEIRYETLPLVTRRPFVIHSNGKIADLFSNFSSYNSYMLKNGWREIIAKK